MKNFKIDNVNVAPSDRTLVATFDAKVGEVTIHGFALARVNNEPDSVFCRTPRLAHNKERTVTMPHRLYAEMGETALAIVNLMTGSDYKLGRPAGSGNGDDDGALRLGEVAFLKAGETAKFPLSSPVEA